MEFHGYDIPVSWILAGLAAILTYIYSTWTFDHFRKQGIPGPPPWPFVGNMLTMLRKGFLGFQVDLTKKYGPIFGIFEGRKPVLYVSDPEMLKQVMVKEFPAFPNRRLIAQETPFVHSLPALQDEDWKRVRSQMTPAFSTGKLKQMTTAINDCADIMVRHMTERSKQAQVDIRKVTSAFTMDVICRTAFGIRVDSQQNPDDPIVKNGQNILGGRLLLTLIGVTWPRVMSFLRNTFSLTIIPQKPIQFFRSVTKETMEQRSHKEKTQVDMMQLMLNAHELEPDKEDVEEDNQIGFKYDAKSKGKRAMSLEELMGNSVVFFLAGSETTASTLAYLLHSLATNQQVHKQLTQEIDDVMGSEAVITQSKYADLQYLDMCIQETLRMYPIAIRVERLCSKDVNVNGVKIAKGQVVTIPIYAMHHNAKYWPDPEKFDPDRFLPSAKAGRDPLTWIPFGFGPRNCIGMRLALMELKIAATKLLQNFTFSPCQATEVPLTFKGQGVLLQTKRPITLKVDRRL